MKNLVYSLPFIAILFFTMISRSFSQDLRITAITRQPSSTVNTGQKFDIEGRMINNTSTNAGPFYIGYWLSANASLGSGDRFLSKKYVSGGLPADQYGRDFEYNGLSIPNDVLTGDHYIILKIDNDNQVYEDN